MDQELFKHTIKNSIVIDLVETQKNGFNDSHHSESPESDNGLQLDDQKVSRNNHKDINRKPS